MEILDQIHLFNIGEIKTEGVPDNNLPWVSIDDIKKVKNKRSLNKTFCSNSIRSNNYSFSNFAEEPDNVSVDTAFSFVLMRKINDKKECFSTSLENNISIVENLKSKCNDKNIYKKNQSIYKKLWDMTVLDFIYIFVFCPIYYLISDFSKGSLILTTTFLAYVQINIVQFYVYIILIGTTIIISGFLNKTQDHLKLLELIGNKERIRKSKKDLKRCNPFTKELTESRFVILDDDGTILPPECVVKRYHNNMSCFYKYENIITEVFQIHFNCFGNEENELVKVSIYDSDCNLIYNDEITEIEAKRVHGMFKLIELSPNCLYCLSPNSWKTTTMHSKLIKEYVDSFKRPGNNNFLIVEFPKPVKILGLEVKVDKNFRKIVEKFSGMGEGFSRLILHNYLFWGNLKIDILFHVLTKCSLYKKPNNTVGNCAYRNYRSDVNKYLIETGVGKILYRVENFKKTKAYIDSFEVKIDFKIVEIEEQKGFVIKEEVTIKPESEVLFLNKLINDSFKPLRRCEELEDNLSRFNRRIMAIQRAKLEFEEEIKEVEKSWAAGKSKCFKDSKNLKDLSGKLFTANESREMKVKLKKMKHNVSIDKFNNRVHCNSGKTMDLDIQKCDHIHLYRKGWQDKKHFFDVLGEIKLPKVEFSEDKEDQEEENIFPKGLSKSFLEVLKMAAKSGEMEKNKELFKKRFSDKYEDFKKSLKKGRVFGLWNVESVDFKTMHFKQENKEIIPSLKEEIQGQYEKVKEHLRAAPNRKVKVEEVKLSNFYSCLEKIMEENNKTKEVKVESEFKCRVNEYDQNKAKDENGKGKGGKKKPQKGKNSGSGGNFVEEFKEIFVVKTKRVPENAKNIASDANKNSGRKIENSNKKKIRNEICKTKTEFKNDLTKLKEELYCKGIKTHNNNELISFKIMGIKKRTRGCINSYNAIQVIDFGKIKSEILDGIKECELNLLNFKSKIDCILMKIERAIEIINE